MPERLPVLRSIVTTPRLLVLAFVVAFGLTAFAGISLVAAQRGSPAGLVSAESYQGCVNTYTGVLRIVGEGQQCADHETPIQISGTASDTALLERINELEGEVEALRAQVPDCLVAEGDDAVFEGCNVHVRSGSSATDGAVNGLGNLIVGYNENDGDTRSGSHNLIVGSEHSYSSYGGIVVGRNNTISGEYSSVSGGVENIASGNHSSVAGGEFNTASGLAASVGGGALNIASGHASSVSGGYQLEADELHEFQP